MNRRKDLIIGFDIGGTKCAILLASTVNGIQLKDKVSFPTETEKGFGHTLGKLLEGGRGILQRGNFDKDRLIAVGISCGGPLDSRAGVIMSPPNLPGWDNVPITKIMEDEFGVKAYLQNDANACALAEWKLGAGKGAGNMVFITMGTGFGAGIIAEGRLIEGAGGQAGEIGHIRLERDGPVGFGKAGSAEGFCGGAGIAEAAALYADELKAMWREPAWAGEKPPDVKTLARYAANGDPDAIEIFKRTGEKLGQVCANLIDLLNPEVIVIGSIFTRCEALIRPAMEKVLQREALPGSLRDCKVSPAQTGESLGDYASIMAACYAIGVDAENRPEAIKPGADYHFQRLFTRYPVMEPLKENIAEAFFLLRKVYCGGGKLLICGNGGSAADAEHIVGELMKGFYLKRETGTPLQGALPAIALTQHSALSTAFMNDVEPALAFAQQVYGYGRKGDALLCISTSGNAENVARAAITAREAGMKVIGLTGRGGGRLAGLCDALMAVPEKNTADIQELHLPLYHTLCAMLEEEFFN